MGSQVTVEERRLRLSGLLPSQYEALPGADIMSDNEFPSLPGTRHRIGWVSVG